MNYMEQIAEMLGVKFYEDFRIKSINEMIFEKKYFLTEYGLFSTDSTVPISTILNDILNGQYEIVKLPQPILTEEEKEYLSYVIKPFRNKVNYICKRISSNGFYGNRYSEYIEIKVNDNHSIYFPHFAINSMYKGMILDRVYSLEELGL